MTKGNTTGGAGHKRQAKGRRTTRTVREFAKKPASERDYDAWYGVITKVFGNCNFEARLQENGKLVKCSLTRSIRNRAKEGTYVLVTASKSLTGHHIEEVYTDEQVAALKASGFWDFHEVATKEDVVFRRAEESSTEDESDREDAAGPAEPVGDFI